MQSGLDGADLFVRMVDSYSLGDGRCNSSASSVSSKCYAHSSLHAVHDAWFLACFVVFAGPAELVLDLVQHDALILSLSL